ncbi:hypothetical protein CDAR_26161 [Caerostris darwini]|uniref:Uncharacterized protein n=1 Tax=Caerostris darwini TaxID=1538125 RepID=A0AAV4N9M3_9ARAC|nr:hypothetical protein CDAR_26161 [Caerostris darwini]
MLKSDWLLEWRQRKHPIQSARKHIRFAINILSLVPETARPPLSGQNDSREPLSTLIKAGLVLLLEWGSSSVALDFKRRKHGTVVISITTENEECYCYLGGGEGLGGIKKGEKGVLCILKLRSHRESTRMS